MISYGDLDYVVIIVFNCTVTPVVPRQPLLRCMILILGNSKILRVTVWEWKYGWNTIKLLTSSPQDSFEFNNYWKTVNSWF